MDDVVIGLVTVVDDVLIVVFPFVVVIVFTGCDVVVVLDEIEVVLGLELVDVDTVVVEFCG